MDKYINSKLLGRVFTVPCALTDENLNIAGKNQLKVILFFLRHISEDITVADISKALSLDESEVEDCLNFWVERGVLVGDGTSAAPEKTADKKANIKSLKPTREEVIERGQSDEKVRFLLREAQTKFGRPLKQNEVTSFVWLYSDEGLDVSLILMLIEYAKSKEKLNTRFIEATASKWISEGITDILKAEQKLAEEIRTELCFKQICAAFGLPYRKPSKKEEELSRLWIDEWNYGNEILVEAYNICVDTTSGFSIPYIAKILEEWHKSGVKTKEDIVALKNKNTASSKTASAYDKDLVNKLLNSED